MRFASVYSQNMRKDGKTETGSDFRRMIEQKRTGEGRGGKSHGAPDIPGYIASAKTGAGDGDGPTQARKQRTRRSVDII